jgi:predicted ribosome quality control (RQC) complex YloA/Tae2 family protein
MNNIVPEIAVELSQLKLTLKEKIETIKKLDEAILDMLEKQEDVESEIETSSEFISEIYGGLAAIEDALKKIDENKSSEVPVEITTATNVSQNSHYTRVKLPKLEVRKFSGKIQDWCEFWDSFESAIHKNDALSDIDEFTYLRGLVEELAKSAIRWR